MFKQLYVYLVLFATLMMSIGGGIGIFTATADLVSPSNGYFERYEDYKDTKIMELKETEPKKEINESEIRKDYDRMIEDDKRFAAQDAKNSLVKSFGFLIIPLPVFLYFNRLRKNKEAAE